MDYMTLKEASEKWGVTPRQINYLCASGRIPGAVKMAGHRGRFHSKSVRGQRKRKCNQKCV